ncbi:MAG: hypothetical protein P4M00_13625 [Azospirillaceae bacterium]|nr:hypothetical protein [Azospirillaceae bacterium]
MIDIAAYRQAESIARQSLNSWRSVQAHHPVTFAGLGFPTSVETIRELSMFIDTMQENRFDPYMVELGGLSDDEMRLFLSSLSSFVKWFTMTFGGGQIPIPLSTMIAHFALFRKLMAYTPNARILEIGPGCGYLSFFLENRDKVTQYCQIEVTQSFYLLQHLINSFLYSENFVDRIVSRPTAPTAELLNQHNISHYESEMTPTLHYSPGIRCEHFPWWEMGELADRRFDIITSNANFTEMTEAAFRSYVTLIARCLEPDGIVFAQCPGGGTLPITTVVRTFEALNFGVLLFASQVNNQPLVVPNIILVREGHPSFSRAPRQLPHTPFVSEGVEWIDRMFRVSLGARMRSRDEILKGVEEHLGRYIA